MKCLKKSILISINIMENLSKNSAKAKLDINDAIYIDNNVESTDDILTNIL